MDGAHCIIAEPVKLRSSNEPQIKRRYNVFFMSVAPAGILSRPRAHRSRVGLRWFGNDAAKIRRKNEMTQFFFHSASPKYVFMSPFLQSTIMIIH